MRWVLALITAAQFREHYPALQGTGEDTVLLTLIARADSLMAQFCGLPRPDSADHTFEDVTYTTYPPGPAFGEPRKLQLPVAPIVSITSAYVDENEDYGASTQVAAGDMVLDGQRGEIWLKTTASSAWATGGRANKVTVVAGFTAAPADLVAACAAAVRHLWNLRNTQGDDNALIKPDAQSLLPESVREALAPYRIWRAAVA